LADAAGLLIKVLRELSRLEWLKVACPRCWEEMTQYLTPQEEVEEALAKGTFLETICSYCQNRIRLDARMFEPRLRSFGWGLIEVDLL
jgi:ribosomal protein S27E